MLVFYNNPFNFVIKITVQIFGKGSFFYLNHTFVESLHNIC